jgi:hypothetical protein
MRRRTFTLDVFTAQRFAGIPLAVVLEPDGLDVPAMQAIARIAAQFPREPAIQQHIQSLPLASGPAPTGIPE